VLGDRAEIDLGRPRSGWRSPAFVGGEHDELIPVISITGNNAKVRTSLAAPNSMDARSQPQR
jgi:hypothetical protein